MKLHKALLVVVVSLFLGACGNEEREIDRTDVDTFIEELSDYFDIQEEPRVFVSDLVYTTDYDLGDFSIEVNGDRELSMMRSFFANEEDTEKLIDFFGLEKTKEFKELKPGNNILITGKYVSLNIDRKSQEETNANREEAEEKGSYFDERNDYSASVLFYEVDD